MKVSDLASAVPLWIRLIVAIGVVVAIVVGARSCTDQANHRADMSTKVAIEKGGADLRAAAAEEGVRDVVKSQDARDVVDRDAAARYDVCMRTSRTKANCRRPAP